MAAQAALLTFHGMGDTEKSFYEPLEKGLKSYMNDMWQQVRFEPIFYAPILQKNQERLFSAIRKETDIDAIKLRKFFLYSFSDAATLEYRREQPQSPYAAVQQLIADKLKRIHAAEGDIPVVIHAQSLGCQVISNYIWDAQQTSPSSGYWKHLFPHENLSPSAESFLRLKSLRHLITTGCNIPIFVAGHDKISAFDPSHLAKNFRWTNLYDADDVLGWPMRQLDASYANLVEDREINANSSFFGTIAKSWNFMSHGEYWGDKDVIKTIAHTLKNAISP